MDTNLTYELVYDAMRQALRDEGLGTDVAIIHRMERGSIVFRDSDGRVFKEVETPVLLRKVTGIRDRLRVLEQKINGNKSLSPADKAELQAYITKSYGSLTTFNFLFAEPEDRFNGTGS